jgi:predicted ATPase
MLQELNIQNFRCFENHTLPLSDLTVIVGVNNAGKSTIIEALRLVSVFANRAATLTYTSAPLWAGIRKYQSVGATVRLTYLEFNLTTLFHRYGPELAKITATFSEGHKIVVYLGPDGNNHALLFDRQGQHISSRQEARLAGFPSVRVLPQIGPLLRQETLLTSEYVERSMDSRLASLHFRNQLQLFDDSFDAFKQLAESTWKGLQIREHGLGTAAQADELYLNVRDSDFVAEVGTMGHGLQMWLQTMWFLARVDRNATVILDEPDVYMHAQLQRQLIRLLRGRYKQVIVATHSAEIMAEVTASQILVVNRAQPQSYFVSSIPALQEVLADIGSIDNIQLARLWQSQVFLLVEGDDVSILKRWQNTLFPDSSSPIDTIPSKDIGGLGAWDYEVRLYPRTMKNALGQPITKYCILDADYYTEAVKSARRDDATAHGFELHIWERKEIENYLIAPDALQRLIAGRLTWNVSPPDVQQILTELDVIAESLKDETTVQFANSIFIGQRSLGLPGAMAKAKEFVESRWLDTQGKLAIVSGKSVLSKLSEWSASQYGVTFGPGAIAAEMRPTEIPDEVARVISAIETCKPFPPR